LQLSFGIERKKKRRQFMIAIYASRPYNSGAANQAVERALSRVRPGY
jgi:hypothetical protein